MNNCKKCAKQFLCNKKECNFISWINTKNYGEVHRIGNTKTYKQKQ